MNGAWAALVAALALIGAPAAHAQPPAAPHQHGSPPPAPPLPPSVEDHSAHQDSAPSEDCAARAEQAPPPSVTPVTEAARQAAFPDVQGHTVHDRAVHYFVLFDQLEGQTGHGPDGVSWDVKGWVGQDRNRLWFRAEGERFGGRFEQAQTNLLYGRAIARWWDVTAGVRLDTLPDTPRVALAFGVQGLAPYWFDVEASAYVEPSGRTHVRVETEHDVLLTNRLVLQPLVEFEIYGRADPQRGLGTGLTAGELGLRLRYEFRREFAPYVGVVWHRKFFGTADSAEAVGERTGGARLAVGLRFWL